MFLASPLIIIPIGELILRGKKRVAYIFTGTVVLGCIVIPMIPDILRDDDPTVTLKYVKSYNSILVTRVHEIKCLTTFSTT